MHRNPTLVYHSCKHYESYNCSLSTLCTWYSVNEVKDACKVLCKCGCNSFDLLNEEKLTHTKSLKVKVDVFLLGSHHYLKTLGYMFTLNKLLILYMWIAQHSRDNTLPSSKEKTSICIDISIIKNVEFCWISTMSRRSPLGVTWIKWSYH